MFLQFYEYAWQVSRSQYCILEKGLLHTFSIVGWHHAGWFLSMPRWRGYWSQRHLSVKMGTKTMKQSIKIVAIIHYSPAKLSQWLSQCTNYWILNTVIFGTVYIHIKIHINFIEKFTIPKLKCKNSFIVTLRFVKRLLDCYTLN